MFSAPVNIPTPPAYVSFAESACSRQTWFHPELRGHGAAQGARFAVVVECERSEENDVKIDRITFYMRAELEDGRQLNRLEADACRPYRGTPCEVQTL